MNRISFRSGHRCARTILALAAAGALAVPALAQPQHGRLAVGILSQDEAFVGRPVMVSAIQDGRIVNQYEVNLSKAPNKAHVTLDRLLPGTADVRVEGDGLVTEVKRGVQVFAGRDGLLQFVVQPGEGVHTVEYAIGGLAREEVAARLMKLEAAVSGLEARLVKP